MRSSILSRSVIAAASLAIGSAALVAVPAHAADTSTAVTPAGVTRETVLAAAAGVRVIVDEASYAAAMKAMYGILNRSCNVKSDDGEALVWVDFVPTVASGHADGIVLVGGIVSFAGGPARECVVGAVAATTPGFSLTGNASLNVTTEAGSSSPDRPSVGIAAGPAALTTALSGDVFTTTFLVPQDEELDGDPSFSASGSSVHIDSTTTSTKVPDKKTKAERKAAKKAHAKKLKAAKKAYDKALKKAGSSKSKKSAAKKAYTKKKADAKAKYKVAIANYKIVKKTTTQTDSRPFSIATPIL